MKKSLKLLPVFFAVLIAGVAIMRSHAVQTGIGTEPEIVSFTAEPSAVRAGQPVTLAWNVRGPATMELESATRDHPDATMPDRANLPANGRMTVYPKEDTIYTLTCETADGPMCTTTATVRAE